MIKKITTVLEYAMMLFVVLSFQTPYIAAIDRDYYVIELGSVFTVLLFFFKYFKWHGLKSIMVRLAFYFVPYYMLMILFLYKSVQADSIFGFIVKYLVCIPVMTMLFCIYMQENKPYQLLFRFEDIVTALAVISLFFWLFGSVLHLIQPTGSIYAHWGTNYRYPSYFGLYFEYQSYDVFGNMILRNQGIFCEGPMHSLILVMALSVELFFRPSQDLRNRKVMLYIGNRSLNKRKIHSGIFLRRIVLVVALITTFTTTGIILLILLFFMNYMFHHRVKTRSALTTKMMLVSVLGIVTAIATIYIFLRKSTSHSWTARTLSFIGWFQEWQHSPIWGIGYGMREESLSVGISNSIAYILGLGGLVLSAVYLFPLIWNICASIIHKRWQYFAYCLVFALEYVFTSFALTLFCLLNVAMMTASLIQGIPQIQIIGGFLKSGKECCKQALPIR